MTTVEKLQAMKREILEAQRAYERAALAERQDYGDRELEHNRVQAYERWRALLCEGVELVADAQRERKAAAR